MWYLIISIIISCELLIGISGKKHLKKMMILLLFLTTIFFIAGGIFNFPDYKGYKAIYELKYDLDIEIGVAFLFELGRDLKLNYNEFLFFLMTFEIATIYWVFIKNKYFSKINLVFFTIYFFPMIANLQSALRQGIAFVFFILSFNFILEKDLKKYLLFIVIGSFFHRSLLFLLPFYFLYLIFNLKSIEIILIFANFIYFFNRKFMVLIIKINNILLSFFSNNILLNRYIFENTVNLENIKILGWLELNFIIISYIILKRLKLLKKSNFQLEKFITFGMITYILNNSLKLGIISHRMNYYLLIFKFLFVANILINLKTKKKIWIILLVNFYFIWFYLFKIYGIFNWNSPLENYKNILFVTM